MEHYCQPMFVGRCAGDPVKFICVDHGGYVILRRERIIAEGPANDLDAGLQQFLKMIDRPLSSEALAQTLHAAPLGRCA